MTGTILVTGATGNTAGQVIAQLRAKGAAIRALVRDAAKAKPLADNGVDLVVGDFDNPDALTRAATGVAAVYLVTPAHPDAPAMVDRFLAAVAKTGGRPRIVRLSAIKGSPKGPTDNTRTHGLADRAIQDSGLPYVILRPNFFMQNLFGSAESIMKSGMMFQGGGEGRLGIIDVRDIADAVTATLLDPAWDRGILELTGPASISFADIARELGAALGREVKYMPIAPEQVGDAIRQMGWGDWIAGVMTDYMRAYTAGWGDFTTTYVEKITGHKPRSFADFAREVFAPAMKHMFPG